MQWTDVVARPSQTQLRQFAGLWLLFFGGLAAWRIWQGSFDTTAQAFAALALVFGPLGLVRPAIMRWIYTGWMVVVFPIGWTVSRLILGLLYFGVFTPFAVVFRLAGRDALRLRKESGGPTHWTERPAVADVKEYLRQS
jgi:hypothetical protein